jgi:hypothetical protein
MALARSALECGAQRRFGSPPARFDRRLTVREAIASLPGPDDV